MARRRKIESVEWIEATRFLIHWFPQIDAERLAYGGVLSGNGYFAPGTRDSVDSSVKYKNDTEGGSKEDIPISIFFLLLFSFPFFFLYRETIERVYSFVRRWSTISKKLIASYFNFFKRKKTIDDVVESNTTFFPVFSKTEERKTEIFGLVIIGCWYATNDLNSDRVPAFRYRSKFPANPRTK